MGEKLKFWRHELKKSLAIRADETPNSVKVRTRVILQKYDPVDVKTYCWRSGVIRKIK
jgi:hypothetical protein